MKLIADEDFPPTLISFLQKKRHDIKRIQRLTSGISDTSIKEKAARERRILLSFDKDFLKKDEEKLFSAVVFDLPYMKPKDILPYMDEAIAAIATLRRKKKSFIAIYSINGLTLIEK